MDKESTNDELRARVTKLEALVDMLHDRLGWAAMFPHDPGLVERETRKARGLFEAVSDGDGVLTAIGTDPMAEKEHGMLWSAYCACGWDSPALTEEDARQRAIWHEEREHRDFMVRYPEVYVPGPTVHRDEEAAA